MATKKAAGLKVKLVKSTIGAKKDQIATANALGLFKIGDEKIQPDNCLLYTSPSPRDA